jgi:hypothetical protein
MICGECTILCNAFRYRERRQQTSENSDESDDSDDDKLEDERGNDDERHAEFKEGEYEVSNLAKSLLTSDCIRQEAVLEAAGFHVTQSRAMRGMLQYRTREAIESLIALKRHDTRYRVLVCDYAQHVNYPHYGGEQPGEIYYLSALTINLFGIVDLSVTPNKLNCCAYRESTAKKGQMGRMVACWIRLCKLQIAMWITHICPNLITQGFVSPCHKYEYK